MRVSPRAWFASPVFPWITGGLLTFLVVPEVRRMDAMSPVILACTFAATIPLVWRRSHPLVAYMSVVGSFLSWLTWEQLWATAFVAGSLGFFTLARRRVANPFVLAACGVTAAILVNWLRLQRGYYGTETLTAAHFVDGFVIAVAIVATVSLGDALRSREETRRVRDAAQARLIEEERRRAVAEERAVVARELHDVVAHSVSVIALQAESATYTTPGLSPQARDGFQQIAASARSSLAELRQLMVVLRSGAPAPDGVELAPQPSLADLEQLIAQHRGAGGSVTLDTAGERGHLPGTLELTAYRIVQEALTNVRRHAPGAHAVVHLDYGPRRLTVRIADDGTGAAPVAGTAPGHGLAGMRERAALLGGRLTAGPGPDGGFCVAAELPVGRHAGATNGALR